MTATLHVNLDQRCKRCKKPGATQNGYCLSCIVKMIDEGKFDHLFDKIKKPEPPK